MIDTHNTTLAVQVGVDLLLKGRLVHVARANRDAERDCLLFRLAGDVLPHSNTGVDAAALLEQGADGAARALGRDEDDVNVGRRHDVGIVLVHDGEAVREVERLALGDEGRNGGPGLRLRGVGEQIHDDSTALNGVFDREEGLTRDLRNECPAKN